jgi:hypothetical protein
VGGGAERVAVGDKVASSGRCSGAKVLGRLPLSVYGKRTIELNARTWDTCRVMCANIFDFGAIIGVTCGGLRLELGAVGGQELSGDSLNRGVRAPSLP